MDISVPRIDSLCLQLQHPNCRVTLAIIYRPPDIPAATDAALLDKLDFLSSSENLVIVGDLVYEINPQF